MTVELLRRESDLLVQRLRLWTPTRWAAGDRAATARHLAQVLADAAADLERGPRRALPDLGNPLSLPDQLAVTADDCARAEPSAAVARDLVLHLLAHRHDLLGDDVPASLAAQLGGGDVLARGRALCER